MKLKIIVVVLVVIVILVMTKQATNKKLISPVKGKLTGKFGDKRAGHLHNGIDLAAPTGTLVLAPADGIITAINNTTDGGNQLFMWHNDAMTTGYAHLSRYLVTVGQKVTQGQAIAEVGNTGVSTGSHLHFTLTLWGIKQDPLKYLPT